MKDGLGHTQNIYDKIKSQVDLQPRDDGTLMEKRRELQREVDIAKRAFTQQVRWKKFKTFFAHSVKDRSSHVYITSVDNCLIGS